MALGADVNSTRCNLSTLLTGLIVPIILSVLFTVARRAKPIETEDGGYLLEYAKAIKGFGIGLSLLILGGLIFLLFKSPIKDADELYADIFIFGLFILFTIYFNIEFFTVKIWVGPKGVHGTSGWRGKREYTWDQISRITYSPLSMWFKISAPSMPSLRIHAMITGLDEFQAQYMKNMPVEKWKSAYDNFNQDKRVNGASD